MRARAAAVLATLAWVVPVVLSRGHAAILVKALGGDITVGTADAFMSGERGNPGPFSVHALMPDGTAGAHGD